MTTFVVEDQESGPRLPAPVERVAPPDNEHEMRAQYVEEITGYVAQMTAWHTMEPDEVLLACSAYSARLSEMRVYLQRKGSQYCKQLLSREVDPLLGQIEFQFRVHSRLLSSRELDLRMSGGQV